MSPSGPPTCRPTRHWSPRLLAVAAIPLLAGLAAGATRTVQVGPDNSLTFAPASVTIDVGDTVEWTWMSGPHTTTRTQGAETWDSGIASAPHRFAHTFSQPGRFPYVCTLHEALGMTGTVIVREASGPTTTSTTLPGTASACQGVSACAAELMAALPTPAAATSPKGRKVARNLQHLAGNAARQLERSTSAGGARQRRLAGKARRSLERLRTVADGAAAKGTLGVPQGPIDAAVGALLALAQAG